MAPEAVAGEPFDRRLDLYSLGCVRCRPLTGRLVFEAGSPPIGGEERTDCSIKHRRNSAG